MKIGSIVWLRNLEECDCARDQYNRIFIVTEVFADQTWVTVRYTDGSFASLHRESDDQQVIYLGEGQICCEYRYPTVDEGK